MTARSLLRAVNPCLPALVLALGFTSASMSSARADAGHFHGALEFLTGFPVGEFGDQVDEVGFGLNLDGGYRPGLGPIGFGARFAWMTYGNTKRKEPFNENIPEVTIEVETSNNLVLGHAYVRFQPAEGSIRPYLDGLIGLSYLYTESQVQSEDDAAFATTTNFDDTVFSFGAGGGLHILLSRPKREPGEEGGIRGVFLEVGGEYIAGGEGRYLKEGSLRREGTPPRLVYEVSESRTDLATAKLGVALEF